MREFVVRYVNGPLQGVGSIAVPDDSSEPPLVQRIPLTGAEHGFRRTLAETYGNESHAIYERSVENESGEWEFQLVRIE